MKVLIRHKIKLLYLNNPVETRCKFTLSFNATFSKPEIFKRFNDLKQIKKLQNKHWGEKQRVLACSPILHSVCVCVYCMDRAHGWTNADLRPEPGKKKRKKKKK